MNSFSEKIFVNNFIVKRLQDRILYELSSFKYREKAIDRFSHNIDDIIIYENILMRSNNISYFDIYKKLNEIYKIENVYIITSGENDRKIKSLNSAIDICENTYSPVILICNENLAFVKTETSIGSPLKYISKK